MLYSDQHWTFIIRAILFLIAVYSTNLYSKDPDMLTKQNNGENAHETMMKTSPLEAL